MTNNLIIIDNMAIKLKQHISFLNCWSEVRLLSVPPAQALFNNSVTFLRTLVLAPFCALVGRKLAEFFILGIVLFATHAEANVINIPSIENFPAVREFYHAVDTQPQPSLPRWNLSGIALLKAVNDYYNSTITYRDHKPGRNYYQTPAETIASGGNCEDYATTKWLALVQNGIDPHDMYFYSGVHSTYKIQHMILAVYLNKHFYYLDNTTDNLDTLTIQGNASWLINRYGVTVFTN